MAATGSVHCRCSAACLVLSWYKKCKSSAGESACHCSLQPQTKYLSSGSFKYLNSSLQPLGFTVFSSKSDIKQVSVSKKNKLEKWHYNWSTLVIPEKNKMVGWVKTTLLFSFIEICAWVKFVRDERNKYKFIHDLPTE